jgi:DNA-binding MarR family transcriptional regulator
VPDGERAARRGLRRHQSLGYQVNHAARLLEQELRRRIEALGVVPGQFAALLALYESDGVTQAELGDRVQIEQSTMTKTLVRMERDGLVSRAPDPHDRRRTLVRLTDHARALEPQLADAARSANDLATSGLEQHEVKVLMTALERVINNLTRTGTRPLPGQTRPSTDE